MHILHFSENMIRLRRERGMTQEQLADFVGVTKAAVSKWETKQSLPDLLMLPKLAACFDVTIDTLLGYEPQLSREQIQRIYRELSAAFAEEDRFEETMERSRELVKEYYTCYPFLFFMGALWLNHFMLAADRKRQAEILEEAAELFRHIAERCCNRGLAGDALMMEATALLQLGRADQVIETLEEVLDPRRLIFQSDALLTHAYQTAGRLEEADRFSQIRMYLHLLLLISDSVWRLTLRADDLPYCRETIKRTDLLLESWQKEAPHPNIALYHLQAAVVYMGHGLREEALERLQRYGDCLGAASEAGFSMRGDRYFDRLDGWLDQLDLGAAAPRSEAVILASAVQGLEHPAFQPLRDDARFAAIRSALQMRGGGQR